MKTTNQKDKAKLARKKLRLTRDTLRTLTDPDQLRAVVGGEASHGCSNNTCQICRQD
jgi:hypothetical protein